MSNVRSHLSDRANVAVPPALMGNWRTFWPGWLAPIVGVYGGPVAERIGHPLLFYSVVMALFMWNSAKAASPWLRREATYQHAVFWGFGLPGLSALLAALSHRLIAATV